MFPNLSWFAIRKWMRGLCTSLNWSWNLRHNKAVQKLWCEILQKYSKLFLCSQQIMSISTTECNIVYSNFVKQILINICHSCEGWNPDITQATTGFQPSLEWQNSYRYLWENAYMSTLAGFGTNRQWGVAFLTQYILNHITLIIIDLSNLYTLIRKMSVPKVYILWLSLSIW